MIPFPHMKVEMPSTEFPSFDQFPCYVLSPKSHAFGRVHGKQTWVRSWSNSYKWFKTGLAFLIVVFREGDRIPVQITRETFWVGLHIKHLIYPGTNDVFCAVMTWKRRRV